MIVRYNRFFFLFSLTLLLASVSFLITTKNRGMERVRILNSIRSEISKVQAEISKLSVKLVYLERPDRIARIAQCQTQFISTVPSKIYAFPIHENTPNIKKGFINNSVKAATLPGSDIGVYLAGTPRFNKDKPSKTYDIPSGCEFCHLLRYDSKRSIYSTHPTHKHSRKKADRDALLRSVTLVNKDGEAAAFRCISVYDSKAAHDSRKMADRRIVDRNSHLVAGSFLNKRLKQ